ncbi:MAG: ABC transporter permease [Spirochaetales bacterium]|nr:ABC transporter permease [Spirochaetales bacterium]
MKRWVFFIAARYFRNKRAMGKISPQSLQILGLSVGVMTLIVVLGVMNGLQLGFIEDILEISSYHLRITSVPPRQVEDLSAQLLQMKGVRSVLPFRDIQTLARGDFENYESLLLRCVPPEAGEKDPSLIKQLNLLRGSFDLSTPRSLVLGYEYALQAGIHLGDKISLISFASEQGSLFRPGTVDFTVTGLFQSGYYDFDKNLAFISLEDAAYLEESTSSDGVILGVKLINRFKDTPVMKVLESSLLPEGLSVISWREYNKSFFGALRMEKLAMMFLVGLMFLVVGVNIFHSQRRAVYERQEEIGILKSVGGNPGSIRLIFLLDGAFIGLTGALIGLLLGLLTAGNLQMIFNALEGLVNWILRPRGNSAGGSALISGESFYLLEVPVRILFHEVLAVFSFAVASTALAAYAASGRVSYIYPQQVLRYE